MNASVTTDVQATADCVPDAARDVEECGQLLVSITHCRGDTRENDVIGTPTEGETSIGRDNTACAGWREGKLKVLPLCRKLGKPSC